MLEILRLSTEYMAVHGTNSTNFKVLDPLHDFMTVDSRNSANSRDFEGVHDLIIVNE